MRFYTGRLALRLSLLLLFILLLGCTPSPEEYLEKAAVELKKENSEKAFLYFQEAYEGSLPETFFSLGKEVRFDNHAASYDRRIVLLSRFDKEDNQSEIVRYDLQESDADSWNLEGNVIQMSLSTGGMFSVLLLQRANQSCEVQIFKESELIKKFDSACAGRPSVSDTGEFWQFRDGKIVRLEASSTGGRETDFMGVSSKVPDPPIKDSPAFGHFYWIGQTLYMTFGYAGLYKLYRVTPKDFTLLSKSIDGGVAASRVFSLPGTSYVGVITGGAGNHRVRFFRDTGGSLAVELDLPVKYWKDILMLSRTEYYYMEGSVLNRVSGTEDKALPFWVQGLVASKGQQIFFLSGLGTFMRYGGDPIPASSLNIFDQGREIDPED